jgi:hypothetical protein
MKLDLIQNFPDKWTPNEAQNFILNEMANVLDSNRKFIVICAPTGSGKSMIAKTLCNCSSYPTKEFQRDCMSGAMYDPNRTSLDTHFQRSGCAVLTCTKSLQDQYVAEFTDGKALKGMVNYPCSVNEDHTYQDGICKFVSGQKKICMKEGQCAYINQRALTDCNRSQFFNYSIFFQRSPKVKHKDFIVCDEASELETLLVNEYTVAILIENFVKLIGNNVPPTPLRKASKAEYLEWITQCQSICEGEVAALEHEWSERNKKSKKKIQYTELNRHRKLSEYSLKLKTLGETWWETEYLIENEGGMLIFKPYNVDYLADRYLFSFGSKVILMSATIIDHENFTKTLGIKPNDYHYIEAPSMFDPAKAPIKKVGDFGITYANKKETLPIVSAIAQKLCEHHIGEKGIIHSHSMEILEYVRRAMGGDKRFLYREDDRTNEDLIKQHKLSSKDTVLVSPSMTHGVDLKGDLGKFQLIMKAPFSPLGDNRIKRKCKEDPQWYTNMMLSTLVQACGRCNRTASDESVTYILDATAWNTVMRNLNRLPEYFRQRLEG